GGAVDEGSRGRDGPLDLGDQDDAQARPRASGRAARIGVGLLHDSDMMAGVPSDPGGTRDSQTTIRASGIRAIGLFEVPASSAALAPLLRPIELVYSMLQFEGKYNGRSSTWGKRADRRRASRCGAARLL